MLSGVSLNRAAAGCEVRRIGLLASDEPGCCAGWTGSGSSVVGTGSFRLGDRPGGGAEPVERGVELGLPSAFRSEFGHTH